MEAIRKFLAEWNAETTEEDVQEVLKVHEEFQQGIFKELGERFEKVRLESVIKQVMTISYRYVVPEFERGTDVSIILGVEYLNVNTLELFPGKIRISVAKVSGNDVKRSIDVMGSMEQIVHTLKTL